MKVFTLDMDKKQFTLVTPLASNAILSNRESSLKSRRIVMATIQSSSKTLMAFMVTTLVAKSAPLKLLIASGKSEEIE